MPAIGSLSKSSQSEAETHNKDAKSIYMIVS